MKQHDSYSWINPIGGFGDMLMLSGVLKQVLERNPETRYNLIRRTNYLTVFKDHPAIAKIGYPGKDEKIANVNYWNMDILGPGVQRAYQLLAKAFGLPVPAEEMLYLPNMDTEDPMFISSIPWKNINIALAPASDSPRKMMPPHLWHALVEKLKMDNYFVIQVGRLREIRIRNCYSLLGLTDLRQLINVLKRCDLIITSDNLIMHIAHMLGKPAIVLWGATLKERYGYAGHSHIIAKRTCRLSFTEECIDSDKNVDGKLYGSPCPHGADHCMARIHPDEIYSLAKKIF